MKKYLAYYENEWPANIAELTAVENKPFVGYLKGLGVSYTVIPEPAEGPANNEIWYTSSNGNVVNPTEPDFDASIVSNEYNDGRGVITFDRPVTSIGDYAFFESMYLISIILPNSMSSIGKEAFCGCYNLISVTFPNSVKSIGDGAFSNCYSLISVTIPTIHNSVTSIGNSAFKYCSSLTSINIPESVTSIGRMAFDGCSDLNSITYEGTTEQWNAITKDSDWNYNVPATYVQCSDGQVPL